MSNKHLQLLDRIKSLNVSLIEKMSSEGMAMMTDRFDESLVRNMLYVEKTNSDQRTIISCVKKNYECWRKSTDALRFWGPLPPLGEYPDFLIEIQMDIECGMIVTEEGSVPEPISPIEAIIQAQLKPLKETFEKFAKQDEKIKNLEENTTITQEEFDKIFPLEDNEVMNEEKTPPNPDSTYYVNRIKELETEVEELKQKIAQACDSDNQVWIDWMDWDVFHPSIKAEEVYKTIDKMATPELREKAKCYAFFRVLKEIKWLKKGAANKDVLKWWSAHFGCEWHNDNQLKFTELPDAITQATTTEQLL